MCWLVKRKVSIWACLFMFTSRVHGKLSYWTFKCSMYWFSKYLLRIANDLARFDHIGEKFHKNKFHLKCENLHFLQHNLCLKHRIWNPTNASTYHLTTSPGRHTSDRTIAQTRTQPKASMSQYFKFLILKKVRENWNSVRKSDYVVVGAVFPVRNLIKLDSIKFDRIRKSVKVRNIWIVIRFKFETMVE
jgi:hypothetical protein